MTTVSGRGVVVTGAASGIGYATAAALGAKGARVVLADVDGESLASAVDRLTQAGVEAHGVLCDVSSHNDVEELADRSFALLSSVHIVFNNAGVAVAGPILDVSHDDWRWVIDVDLWGAIHGVEAFLPRLVAQGEGGHLAFTASFAGLVPNVGLGPYCVAKYGVVALAEVLSKEVRAHDIGVSVLCPMRVETDIGRSHRHRQPEYGSSSSLVPDQSAANDDLAGRVLPVNGVADLTVDAIEKNRLYVLPHEESRRSIQRRFASIDRTFDDQRAAGV